MKPGGGKAKGGQYERDKCRQLSLWISKGVRDDLMWRSAGSGSVATVRRKKGKEGFENQLGDICSTDPLSEPFLKSYKVECKFYKDLSLQNLFFRSNCKGLEFWETHVRLCDSKRFPLCLMKQNFRPDTIWLPLSLNDMLPNVTGVSVPEIGCVVYVLDAFLTKVTHDELLQIAKQVLEY